LQRRHSDTPGVQNDELLERGELERGEVVTGFEAPHPVFTVSKVSLGPIYDFFRAKNMEVALAIS